MTNRAIEGLRGRVVSQTQDVAAADAGEPAGSGTAQRPQGAHAPNQLRIGAFPGARFGGGEGIELERLSQLSTVRAVGIRANPQKRAIRGAPAT